MCLLIGGLSCMLLGIWADYLGMVVAGCTWSACCQLVICEKFILIYLVRKIRGHEFEKGVLELQDCKHVNALMVGERTTTLKGHCPSNQ